MEPIRIKPDEVVGDLFSERMIGITTEMKEAFIAQEVAAEEAYEMQVAARRRGAPATVTAEATPETW